jgi:hypothetical protein
MAFLVVVAACGGGGEVVGGPLPPVPAGPVDADGSGIPPAPEAPDGPLAPDVVELLDDIFFDLSLGFTPSAVRELGESGDARVAWVLSDLLRFFQLGPERDAAVAAFEQLTGTTVPDLLAWSVVTDWLIAWDVPEPPGYVDWKWQLYSLIEPKWEPFFTDDDADVDWRLVTWGGVLIDDRPLDRIAEPCPFGCIPALDDPVVTTAAGGDWYPDDRVVFGVVVDGEARAYPKNIMEVHEMVNDTLGGRRIGIPYCTLCGSAQAYFTDEVGGGPVELRTSGLLSRSNKVMYDLFSFSLFDTFTGRALSGPRQDGGVVLEMVTVVASRWGDWKAAHPDTTIVASDGGIGRTYDLDPLQGRDDAGPIFPVGDVDPRLPVQERVIGVEAPDGTFVAFSVESATAVLGAGERVELAGVRVVSRGGGLTAETLEGEPLVSHESFWFAWSQFHPDTLVWGRLG